jgi:hypothetical protein
MHRHSPAPEPLPLARSVSRFLRKRGLSLGDAVNVLLFFLTIISLYFAWDGVEVARATLKESDLQEQRHQQQEQQQEVERKQELQARDAEHKQELDKTQQHEDEKFNQQLHELKSSADALNSARKLLDQEGSALQGIQKTSQKQLEDFERVNAQPRPAFQLTCNSEVLARYGELETKPQVADPKRLVSPTFDSRGLIQCSVRFQNRDANLRQVAVKALSKCANATADPSFLISTDFFGRVKDKAPRSELILIDEDWIEPTRADEFYGSSFGVANTGTCSLIELTVRFSAENFPGKDIWGLVGIPSAGEAQPVWSPDH